jgi:hypothetical protein
MSVGLKGACSLLFLLLLPSSFGQQPDAQPIVPAQSDQAAPRQPQAQQSLGDIARRLRKNRQLEVQISSAEAKELFALVDKILDFATEDTLLPRKAPVKRRLVGQDEVERYFRLKLAKAEYAQRFARAELTMKKFGLLPRDFNLSDFLVRSTGEQVAGFYDDETKTISLLNWVPLEEQQPILAHELTHALQDQNYNLKEWAKAGLHPDDPKGQFAVDDEESEVARHAVAEGQAMIVYFDYVLAPMGRTLNDTPGIVASLDDPAVRATPDTAILHNAPLVLREAGTFPYREGLIFEATLLQRGGKQAAFLEALNHPPRNTHEVLQPEAYLSGEKLPPLRVPDLRPIVAGQYELFDSGAVGELDVRILLKQLGEKRTAADLASAWRGGAYVAFRRQHAQQSTASTSPSEIALVYVSRWKSPQAAQKFAKLYAAGVTKRYQTTQWLASACFENCPMSAAEISTEEGPVIVEQWPDNTVVVSESFDESTAAKLRNAVLDPSGAQTAAWMASEELSGRLSELPAFRAFQNELGMELLRQSVANARRRSGTK